MPLDHAPRRAASRILPNVLFLLAAALSFASYEASASSPFLRTAPRDRASREALLRRAQDPSLPAVERKAAYRLGRGGFAYLPPPEFAASATSPSRVAGVLPPVASCGEWTEISPSSPVLSRWDHTLIVDPVRDRMILFGGAPDESGGMNDVWVADLATPSVWTELTTSGTPPTPVGDAVAIYDAARDRMIVFGGYVDSPVQYSNEVWELRLGGGTPRWRLLSPAGTPPPGRTGHTAIYDAGRDRMVVFGGYNFDSVTVTFPELNDVWALSLAGGGSWTEITPSGTLPRPRDNHTAIYDAPNDRMIVFAGFALDADGFALPLNDLWSLSFAGPETWTELKPAGTIPLPRFWHSAIVDESRARMIVYAGSITLATQQHDTEEAWSLSLNGTLEWTLLAPLGDVPTATDDHAAVYDAARDRMVVFGGFAAAGDETWALDLAGGGTWAFQGTSAAVPRSRHSHTIIHDVPRHRLILFGGVAKNWAPLADTWAYSLLPGGGWSRLDLRGNRPFAQGHTALFDASRDRMLVWGGIGLLDYNTDVWALSLAGTPAWTRVSPLGPVPPGRWYHVAILDPSRDRMVVDGGIGDYGTWALDLADLASWTQLSPGGTVPAFYLHAAAYDAPRDRMVVLKSSQNFETGELWELAFAGAGTWTQLSPTGVTPTTDRPSLVVDAARNRMLAFGHFGETYALTLAGPPAWSIVGVPPPTPRGRDYHAAVFDDALDRMILFGGAYVPYQEFPENEVLELSFAGVFALNVSAQPAVGGSVVVSPDATCFRSGSQVTLTAVPATGYRFLHWSGDVSGSANPLVLTLGGDKTIIAVFEEIPTATLVARFDVEPRDGAIEVRWSFNEPGCVASCWVERAEHLAGPWDPLVIEARNNNGTSVGLDRTAELGRDYWYRLAVTVHDGNRSLFGPVSARSGNARAGLSDLESISPNPSFAPLRVGFTLVRGGPVRLSLFDVAGREVAVLANDVREPGSYTAVWDGSGDRGRLPAGVYLIRLAAPDRTIARRVAMIQ